LCGAGIFEQHAHVLQRSNRQILCSCDPCAVLFTHREDGRELVRIPREARKLTGFAIGDAEWSSLRLPIDLAFFVRHSADGRTMAYYPSPAGCTESLLPLDAWPEIARGNPAMESMEPDVEALLVDRTRGQRRYFIAPIDQCYQLTGVIRKEWRGFSGGEAVWREVDLFFGALEERGRA
jgi:hypothetical protein